MQGVRKNRGSGVRENRGSGRGGKGWSEGLVYRTSGDSGGKGGLGIHSGGFKETELWVFMGKGGQRK